MGEQEGFVPGQMMSIGVVAASNIVRTLGLAETAIKIVEQAIADEIQVMTSHFTTAVLDVQNQYQQEVKELKSTYRWAKHNKAFLFWASVGLLCVGYVLGQYA